MLLSLPGGKTSYSFVSDSDKTKISRLIENVQPFEKQREKIFYFDKSSGSVFSGLTPEKIDNFLSRNKKNYSRTYPHKNLV